MTDLTNQPDATRLIYGLRDTGYNFNTAAADIIDNSIAANAANVNVLLQLMHDGRKIVCFGDDGDGMSADMLFQAMRYGAPVRENLASLGKFGLGLKTASTSVCLRLTVISKQSSDDPFAKLAWDLEHVEQVNEWVMLQEAVSADELDWFEELCGSKGTLVVWSNCDRLLSKEYEQPGGTLEQAAVRRLAERLREHVGLIYYRFLDGSDARERNVTIRVDNEEVTPWNPFYPEMAEQVLPEKLQRLEVEMEDGTTEEAEIRAWILPNSRDLSADEKKKARISNRGQGFYIHREGRVIQQGGWLGVFGAVEPHTSLLRIEFDFSHKLDHAFHVPVDKSKIRFDPALQEELTRRLQPFYREAGNRYRRKEKQAAVERGIDHDSANKVIGSTPLTKQPSVESVDTATQTTTLANNRGPSIRLKVPIDTNASPKNIYLEAVGDIRSGNLWEPAMRSADGSGMVAGVRINMHHDFYQKIYQRAAANGYAVEGIDLLLWAFATAEQNNTSSELEPIFEDIRDEISSNLKRLLREVPLPDDEEMMGTDTEAA